MGDVSQQKVALIAQPVVMAVFSPLARGRMH
jgi:hypothetical protein